MGKKVSARPHPPPRKPIVGGGGASRDTELPQALVTCPNYLRFRKGGGERLLKSSLQAPDTCGCHCADSKVSPSGSAAGDRESVTATTPPSGLQEPGGEPVPNNEVHLKSPAGGRGREKEKHIKERAAGKRRTELPRSAGNRQGKQTWKNAGREMQLKIPNVIDVALQLQHGPTPQPCSPGALAAAPTGAAS